MDYKSHASFTARRLVGQIRTIDRRARSSTLARMMVARQKRLASSSSNHGAGTLSSQQGESLAEQELVEEKEGSTNCVNATSRRQFKYTFTPSSLAAKDYRDSSQWSGLEFDRDDEHQAHYVEQNHGQSYVAGGGEYNSPPGKYHNNNRIS